MYWGTIKELLAQKQHIPECLGSPVVVECQAAVTRRSPVISCYLKQGGEALMRGIFKTQLALSAGLKTSLIRRLVFGEERACVCTPSDLADRSRNDRTDMVFIADFSVNRAGSEPLLSFGIMAVLL